MNTEQQAELLSAIVDLRKRVAELERERSRFDKLIKSIESKVESTAKIASNLIVSLKQLSGKVTYAKERLSSVEVAVRRKR